MKRHYILLAAIILLLFSVTKTSAQVTVDATSGTPTGSYTTLKAAADSINSGFHQGAIDIRIHTNTTETATITFNASGSGSASYTSILVRPADTATAVKVVTTSVGGSTLLVLNGADNVTFDGRPLGAGSSRFLTFSHTSNSNLSNTVLLQNDATNNVFQFVTMTNARTVTEARISLAASVMRFGGTITATGNSDNSILNCALTGGTMGINFNNGVNLINPSNNITIRGNAFLSMKNYSWWGESTKNNTPSKPDRVRCLIKKIPG